MSPRGSLVSICGPIGAGKTTIAQYLCDALGPDAVYVPEFFRENPYLELFYQDGGIGRWGIHTELTFLMGRAHQAWHIGELVQQGKRVITDWTPAQNLLFSGLTLEPDDYALYQQVYHRVMDRVPQPDLLICLDATVPALLDRIQGRGRDMERTIDPAYVARVRDAYQAWRAAPPAPLYWVDTTHRPVTTSFAARLALVAELVDQVQARMPEASRAATVPVARPRQTH